MNNSNNIIYLQMENENELHSETKLSCQAIDGSYRWINMIRSAILLQKHRVLERCINFITQTTNQKGECKLHVTSVNSWWWNSAKPPSRGRGWDERDILGVKQKNNNNNKIKIDLYIFQLCWMLAL